MSASQLHPLQVNPQTGEPFLRLPPPLDRIIITPPRMTDVGSIVEILNDPKVYSTLIGPPFPYLEHHAVEWLTQIKQGSDNLLEELRVFSKPHHDSPSKNVGGCPVRTLREVQEDGTDVFLGDLGVDRSSFPYHLDEAERAKLEEENNRRGVGDEDIVWCIGDYLRSSHHGRGIMTAAIRTLIHEWMVPRMNAHIIRAEAFIDNVGSVRVFQKSGFVLEETVDYVQATKAGIMHRGSHILCWRSGEPQ